MSNWEEWRVGPYHQPRSTAHPPPHQSAVLCGHWLHQWVEQDMVTTCRLKRSPGVLQWYCGTPHQSAVLCGHWLHQWVEQDMVTTCRLKRSPGVLQWYCDATPSRSPPSIKGRTSHHLGWLRGCLEFYSGHCDPTLSMPPPIFSLWLHSSSMENRPNWNWLHSQLVGSGNQVIL